MVNVDQSLFIQIINFLLLIWVLNLIVYKPIRSVLLQRKEKIAGLEQDIQTSKKDAVEKKEAFSSGIKKAREQGLKEKAKFIQEAVAQEKEIVDKINKKALADMAEFREKITKDMEAVKASLSKEIVAFASDISQKILGRGV